MVVSISSLPTEEVKMSALSSERCNSISVALVTLGLMTACGVGGLSVHGKVPVEVQNVQQPPAPQPTSVITTPQVDILVSFLDSTGVALALQSIHAFRVIIQMVSRSVIREY